MSSSFRDLSGLSERLRGKSTDQIIQEMRNSMDESKKNFFSRSRPSWFSSASTSRRFPEEDEYGGNLDERLDRLAEEHPELAEPLRSWRDGSAKKKRRDQRYCDPVEKREAGRRLDSKLSSTVPDMRREQQEDQDRVGRSQSAPPSQQQAEDAHQPIIRHIPIFVEGRDEPVIPKDFVDSPFPREKRDMSRENSPVPPPRHQKSDHHYSEAEQTRPQHTSTVHINHDKDRQVPIEIKINSEHQTSHKPPTTPSPAQTPPPPTKTVPAGPLEKVQAVQDEVNSLVKKVESYQGDNRQDKEYVYLDEMLTRNLLKLDDIETEGKDDVRTARKEAIRQIQRCISLLEGKAPAPPSSLSPIADESSQQSQESTVNSSNESTTQPLASS